MLNLQFELDGAVIFNRSLSRFGENLRDLRQIWPAVTIELRQIVKEQFNGRGVGPAGQWQPLSDAYRKWKEKKFPGQPLLVRSGDLIQSLTTNTAHTVNQPLPDSLTFGTRLKYATYHQRGGKRLPRRPIFDLNENQKDRITKAVQRRLVAAGRDNGISLQ